MLSACPTSSLTIAQASSALCQKLTAAKLEKILDTNFGTSILMPASSLMHHISTPTGPSLDPTDWGRSLCLCTRSWSSLHGLLWLQPYPLTDHRMVGDKTEGWTGAHC